MDYRNFLARSKRLRAFPLIALLVFVSAPGPHGFTFAQSSFRATSSFKAPKGCKNAPALAAAVNAVQACQQRFSPTHEFAIVLLERRFRVGAKPKLADKRAVKDTVRRYVRNLRKSNASAPGQTLGMFETSESVPDAELPRGAEFCTMSNGVILDRRVPGYIGEEFRLWLETRVCARFDRKSETIQLVELRASERFRAATDGKLVKERFKYLTPSVEASKAAETLKLY